MRWLILILYTTFIGCVALSHTSYAEWTPRDAYRAAYKRIEAAIENLDQISPRGVRVHELEQRWERENGIDNNELAPSPSKIKLVDNQASEMEAWVKDNNRLDWRTFTLEDISNKCTELPPPDESKPSPDCRVEEFGKIGGQDNLRYQTYTNKDKTSIFDPPLFVVLFSKASSRADAYKLFGWALDDVQKPYFVHPDRIKVPLVVLHQNGQGAAGRWFYDVVYADNAPNGGWWEIDATSWLNEANRHVRKGFDLNQLSEVDYRQGIGQLSLMRDSDAMCCPSAGIAVVELGLRSRRLVIEGWHEQAR